MNEHDKDLPVPHFLRQKNEKTFREVYKLLEGLPVEEINEILRAITVIVPSFAILRRI